MATAQLLLSLIVLSVLSLSLSPPPSPPPPPPQNPCQRHRNPFRDRLHLHGSDPRPRLSNPSPLPVSFSHHLLPHRPRLLSLRSITTEPPAIPHHPHLFLSMIPQVPTFRRQDLNFTL
ncbi:hypothetical protein GBA52_026263 [Prunus armeniaca]|nr:hypothetical protein GBA52_026263 [Prunus armeniaca]